MAEPLSTPVLEVRDLGVRFTTNDGPVYAVNDVSFALGRGQTLSLRTREFVEAARATGVPTWRIIASHIVPNLLGIVVIYTTVTVPSVILTESVLSFLGLGIQEPMTSWGVLIEDGTKVMEIAPWMLLFPATLLAVTLYCFNFVGDGLRDALDPKERIA